MRHLYLLCVLLYFGGLPNIYADEAFKSYKIAKVLGLTIDSSINPATFSYLKTEYERAKQESFDAVLLRINTPGGLVSTTKDILTMMGESPVPTFVWIYPEGASASSAGAIIASGAHILAMAPGTNLGAATPVQMGKDLEEGGDLRKKAINDLLALVESLSESRGRNAEKFGKMVEEAASFKSKEALDLKLIDFIANTEEEFLEKTNGLVIKIQGQASKLEISSKTRVVDYEMDFGQKVLNILASPELSYVLFLAGAALIYLEVQTGGFIAGSIGAISLVLAGIGFQVLPLNFGALGLIALAFVFFLLETYIASYGLLSLFGLTSLILGSLFLYRTDEAYISVSKSLIYTSCGIFSLFIILLLFYLLRERKKGKIPDDYYSLVDKEAVIVNVLPDQEDGRFYYTVRVSGELWKAQSEVEHHIGNVCKVKANSENMILKI